MIELEWGKEGKEKQSLKSREGIIGIGRNKVNEIILGDDEVSSCHAAVIENELGGYFVRDLGSLNGIKVNGISCYRKAIFNDDLIKVCSYAIRVKRISKTEEQRDDTIKEMEPDWNIEIPFIDFKQKPFKSLIPAQKTKFIIEPSMPSVEIASIISELDKLNDFEFILSQLLKEVCDTLVKARCGYLALLDEKKRLFLKKKIRTGSDHLPEMPKKLFRVMMEDGHIHFAELEGHTKVALIPVKIQKGIIGVIYLCDLPDNLHLESKKSTLSLLIESGELKRHLDKSYHNLKTKPGSEVNGIFKWKEKFVGYKKTKSMKEVYDKMEDLGKTDKPVVILGDTGTGKTELAIKIHEFSRRRKKAFLRVDLNTISDTLIESEMFGTVKGGFTGSVVDRPGYFEHANGGTLFLDEIGNLSLTTQNKLLQPLDDHPIIRRIGSVKEVPIDVRIVAATNKDLEGMVKEGKFKEDLYRRLGIGFSSITLPLLIDRKEDIPLLVHFFIDCAGTGSPVEGISRSALGALMSYDWWGNIGSLRSIIRQTLSTAGMEGRKVISISDLPEKIGGFFNQEMGSASIDHFLTLEEIEKNHIQKALELSGHNKTQAATLLGITRPTLNAKLAKYGIQETSE